MFPEPFVWQFSTHPKKGKTQFKEKKSLFEISISPKSIY
jgi:hypothetical protein